MKKHKEIFTGIIISIVGFILAIVVALLVVESKVPSNASNDGWLGFLGGLFGSFISGVITFWVLYINRKDMKNGEDKRLKISEMDKMESDLINAFTLLKSDGKCLTAKSYFGLIIKKIPEINRQTQYYQCLHEVLDYCNEGKILSAMALESKVYEYFVHYREMYIKGK